MRFGHILASLPAAAPQARISDVHIVPDAVFDDLVNEDYDRRAVGRPRRSELPLIHGLEVPTGRPGVYLREIVSQGNESGAIEIRLRTLIHELLHRLGGFPLSDVLATTLRERLTAAGRPDSESDLRQLREGYRRLDEGVTQYLALGARDGIVDRASVDANREWGTETNLVLDLTHSIPGVTANLLANAYFRGDLSMLTGPIDRFLGSGATNHLLMALGSHQDDVIRDLLAGRRQLRGSAQGLIDEVAVDQPSTPGSDLDRQRAHHPESLSYADWIASFRFLVRFAPQDQTPGREGVPVPTPVDRRMDVLGERAPRGPQRHPPQESVDAPQNEAPPRIDERPGDQLVDHPILEWLRAFLPDDLVEYAYRLPADCADVAIVLRHVWLCAHHLSQAVSVAGRTLRIGEVPGDGRQHISHVMTAFSSANAQALVRSPYRDRDGRPVRSFAALQSRLQPGDVLVWRHEHGGGHVQTVMEVHRASAAGPVTRIDTLAGNQPLPEESGPRLRWTPGRRIEVQYLEGPELADQAGVWTWPATASQGRTRLVVAGPP